MRSLASDSPERVRLPLRVTEAGLRAADVSSHYELSDESDPSDLIAPCTCRVGTRYSSFTRALQLPTRSAHLPIWTATGPRDVFMDDLFLDEMGRQAELATARWREWVSMIEDLELKPVY